MNFLLTLIPLSLAAQISLILLGLSLPLLWIMARKPLPPGREQPSSDFLKSVPVWIWMVLALGAGAARFSQLTRLSLWPLDDEAMSSHYALELARFGHWQWTYDFSGLPPLYIWVLGGVYKLFKLSLFTLWFPPAFFSCLGLFFLWKGARRLFNPTLTFVFTFLGAFSFWPLYLARFSVEGGFMVVWECLVFERWSAFHQAGEKEKPLQALILGIASGIGFFTFQAWPVAACLLTLAVLGETLLRGRGKAGLFLRFFIPQVLFFLLLASQSLPDRAVHYAYAWVNPFGPGGPGLNDLFVLFWGSRLPMNYFAYRPWGGGFLNPVLASFFFWGAFAPLYRREWNRLLLGLGAFLLLLLPGLITGGADAHRIALVCPFLLFVSAYGMVRWLQDLSFPWKKGVLALLLLLSAGWDLNRLFVDYGSLWTQPGGNWFATKSVERLRAFQILEPLAQSQGPGFVISELVPDLFDQSLSDLTFPFNICENPSLSPEKARWAAILINQNYRPFLEKEFPSARWVDLADDADRPNGGLMLGFISLPCPQAETLNRMILADQASHQLVDATFDNHDWKSREPILRGLFARYQGNFQGDRFLEACFFEKVAEQDYRDKKLEEQAQALNLAVERGLPAAHLFNARGALDLRSRQWKEARKCFQTALKTPGARTSAQAGLEALEEMEKSGKPPAGIP